jgi:predicted transcriptional regulator of viral defense system
VPAEQEILHPDWNRLFEVAEAQKGYFTTQQAAAVGYSPQLVAHHLHAGRFARALRGVYRLVHFPVSEHEELAVAWLWSNGEGVVSHQTALALHGLSDALPAGIHLTLPSAWKKRRLRVPEGITLHYANVPPNDFVWFGPAPVTAPRRTLSDCARAGLSPELLKQAARQALRRGLVTKDELVDVEEALKPFGGLGA